MKKSKIIWLVIIGGILLLMLGRFGRNLWLSHDLQGKWQQQAVEVNDGKLIPLSTTEREMELTAQGDYILDQQKIFDYRFKQRFGRLYIQLYHQGQADGPPISEEYLVRKHGEVYTFTNNEQRLKGRSVATGTQLSGTK